MGWSYSGPHKEQSIRRPPWGDKLSMRIVCIIYNVYTCIHTFVKFSGHVMTKLCPPARGNSLKSDHLMWVWRAGKSAKDKADIRKEGRGAREKAERRTDLEILIIKCLFVTCWIISCHLWRASGGTFFGVLLCIFSVLVLCFFSEPFCVPFPYSVLGK